VQQLGSYQQKQQQQHQLAPVLSQTAPIAVLLAHTPAAAAAIQQQHISLPCSAIQAAWPLAPLPGPCPHPPPLNTACTGQSTLEP
jgi:hypothetical protein